MADSESLRRRLRADLTDDLSVTATAVGLGLVAYLLLALDALALPASGTIGPGFLLMMALLDTTFVYDYWPVTYTPAYAVGWTLAVGVLSLCLFLAAFELATGLVGVRTAGVAAFLVTVGTQFGGAIAYSRVR
jgi:hypothetical protein